MYSHLLHWYVLQVKRYLDLQLIAFVSSPKFRQIQFRLIKIEEVESRFWWNFVDQRNGKRYAE
jgi:hypothetical protein